MSIIICKDSIVLDTSLTATTRILKSTSLFSRAFSANQFVDSQLLFLTIVGLKPVSLIYSSNWQETVNGGMAIPGDLKKVKAFLDQLPVVYEIEKDSFTLACWVAQKRHDLQFMRSTANDYEQGVLFGYPATAAAAFVTNSCLPIEEQHQFLHQYDPQQRIRKLVCFRLSKQAYRNEMRTVETWFDVLHQYDLLDSSFLRMPA